MWGGGPRLPSAVGRPAQTPAWLPASSLPTPGWGEPNWEAGVQGWGQAGAGGAQRHGARVMAPALQRGSWAVRLITGLRVY